MIDDKHDETSSGPTAGGEDTSDYGADSILLSQVLGHINKKLDPPLAPTALYEYTTLNTLAAAAASALPAAHAQAPSGASAGAAATGIDPRDCVFITNEDSNTLVVIDPKTNTVESTINLTSFDEDPRPPFRYVTAGVAPMSTPLSLNFCAHAAASATRPMVVSAIMTFTGSPFV